MKKLKGFEGVYVYYHDDIKKLATKNLTPGISVYGEDLLKDNDDEYRSWIMKRSKLAAAIYKGLS